MSKRRTERLLSIVVLLLSSRRYLTAEEIRAAVRGYPEEHEAFKRMFERDKEELRELGIPLETGLNNALDEEPGYRIKKQDYELPEIRLEADEAAVLGIASRVWQSAALAGAAAGALLKLKAAGAAGTSDDEDNRASGPGIEPRLTTQEPAFGPLWEAVRDRRPVTFAHQASGRSGTTKRELEPWGVVNWKGRWYVAGHDRTRNAPRVFRLSRITGPVKMAGPVGSVTVPPGADVRELVKDWDSPARDHTAVLGVRADAGFGLRRWAAEITSAGAGWDRVTVSFADVPWYADYLAWFGPDVMVLEPPDLREAVISRLKGVLALTRGGMGGAQPPTRGGSPGGRPPGQTQQPRMVTSAERLRRLLALVPYVVSRKVVGLSEAAAAFGMTERELIDDLNLAWCVELKAPEPYCPIDLSYEGGEITVSQAESIARPLRLAADEASALLVALRMLAEVPSGDSAVARLIAKIEAAAGASAAASSQVTIQIDSPNVRDLAAKITTALAAGKRLHLRYYVPSRDEATERDVDPMRLLVVEGRTYLEGWCRLAEGVRLFRLDRVIDLDVLDVPREVPEDAEGKDVDAGLFQASESDERVELELSSVARWVAEYYPCESVTELGEGRLRVVLRTPDTGWVRRLALRLGEDAQVVAPATLAAEVRESAAAALALYDLP